MEMWVLAVSGALLRIAELQCSAGPTVAGETILRVWQFYDNPSTRRSRAEDEVIALSGANRTRFY
jgi:hypothetical protein